MIRVFLDDNLQVISLLTGILETLELNTPQETRYIDTESDLPSLGDYYDEVHKLFVSTGEPPESYMVFDYAIKQWIDPRSLDEIKAQKWETIKAERDQLEFGGFTFEGDVYDSDQVAQGRIMGAALAGIDQVWTLADNTTVALSASELPQLYAALQAHIASVHERGRIARQLINDAETKEEVGAIQL